MKKQKLENIHVNKPNDLSAPNNSRKQATIFGAKKVCMCLCDDENCLNLGQQSLGLNIRAGGPWGTRGARGGEAIEPPSSGSSRKKYIFSITINEYMSINNQYIYFVFNYFSHN
jgi:hypothetical protein